MEVIIEDVLFYGIKLVICMILAGIIGFEREKQEKAAGLRTHMIICMSSCVFTLVGLSFVDAVQSEITRVFQGIVTGVGFVGAGAIIRDGGSVKGITTASTIWIIAAVGMAVATGEYVLAGISSILTFIVIKVFGNIQHRMHESN